MEDRRTSYLSSPELVWRLRASIFLEPPPIQLNQEEKRNPGLPLLHNGQQRDLRPVHASIANRISYSAFPKVLVATQ